MLVYKIEPLIEVSCSSLEFQCCTSRADQHILVFLDDSSEDCKPRNATALRPVSDNVDYAPTKPKVAEKKGKKTEKKKKGEKGHSEFIFCDQVMISDNV